MKRNSFIASMILMVAAPFKTRASFTSSPFNPGQGFKIAKGEGRKYGTIITKGKLPGTVDLKVSGSDNNDGFAVLEQTVTSRGAGVPLHYHPEQDEMFYILDGTYRFKVGEEVFDLKAGDSIFLPRKVPHAWMLLSDKGTTHCLVQPAGLLESFFVKLNGLQHVPTPEEIGKISAESGMITIGPPLKLD